MREKIFDLTISLVAMFLAIMLMGLFAWISYWVIGVEKMGSIEKFMGAFSGAFFFFVTLSILWIILIFLGMFVLWLFKDEGMMILPFEVAEGEKEKCSGKAISDLLTAELRRIKRIHEVEAKKIQPMGLESKTLTESEKFTLPAMVPPSEILAYKVAEAGAVRVGPAWVLIGPLLAALKQLWPGGDTEQVITGSLQKYGLVIYLVAHLEHHEIRAWEVRHEIRPQDKIRDEQIPYLVRDLAFKIAKDHASEEDGQAKTWQGFKYFTEALHAYYRYTLTEDERELERAQDSCLQATKAGIGYEKPFNLLYNLGIAYLNKEKYVVAERLFRQALETKSDDVLALVMLGDVHFAQNHTEDGLKCCYKATSLDPKNASDWMGKGIAYGWLDRYDEALRCFDKAIFLGSEYAIAWYNRGVALWRLRREEEALECFAEAASLNPEDALFWYNKGVAFEKLDRKEEALECFDKVSALAPAFDFDWIKEGNTFMKSGDIKKALTCYEKAIIYGQKSQKIVSALTSKGNALTELGDIEQALRCYMTVLNIDPGYSPAGFGLMKLGHYDVALKCFDKAISLNQKDCNAWAGKGTVLRIQGKNEEAIKCFEKALEYNPVHAIYYISLAAVYRKLDREDERIQMCEKAHRFLSWPEYHRASFHAICGSTDKALDLLRTALEKNQISSDWARQDPDFEFIRDDPRFQALLDEFSEGKESS